MRRRWALWAAYALLLGVVILTLFPIAYVVFGSFKEIMELLTGGANLLSERWTVANYAKAWRFANFGRYTVNSLVLTSLVVLGTLFTTSMAAYALARAEFPGKRWMLGTYTAALFISVGAITLRPQVAVIVGLGLQNTMAGVALVMIAGQQVVNTLLTYGYIRTLPRELDEAAIIDGAGFFKIYASIVLPLCKPILATVSLLTFRASWNEYLLPLILLISRRDLWPLTVGVVSLRDQGSGAAAWDLMMAGSVISLIPILVAYLFLNRFFISGITAGALKE